MSGEGPGAGTFVFADLAGYTALTESHGDAYAADVASVFIAGVREALASYDAQEVKALGDGVLVRVAYAEEALHFAARLVCDFGPRHGQLGVRVGMHTGPAVEREGDWFGAAVNVASRVAAAARSGEVLLTGATRDALGDSVVPGQLRRRGPRALKNVADPVELYVLIPDGHPADRALPIDPVCRMAVDPAKGGPTLVHRGVEYHFCSRSCLEAFEQRPDRYASRGGRRGSLLVSDAARERVALRLARAYEKGRIDHDELEERSERVWRARTRADLRALTADLPRPRRRPPWWWFGPAGPFVLLARWLGRVRQRRLGRGPRPPELPPY